MYILIYVLTSSTIYMTISFPFPTLQSHLAPLPQLENTLSYVKKRITMKYILRLFDTFYDLILSSVFFTDLAKNNHFVTHYFYS